MKSCGYCGRENTDEATRCRECGIEFAQSQLTAASSGGQQQGTGIWSGLVFCASFCIFASMVLATIAWLNVVMIQPDTWGAFIFQSFAIIITVASIVLVLIPGIFLYRRKRQRFDLVSLGIAGFSLLILCTEFIALFFIPLRPASPAG